MTLKDEIQQILSAAKTALTVKTITLMSKLTQHESRVGEACRELDDNGLLRLSKVNGGIYNGVGYEIR